MSITEVNAYLLFPGTAAQAIAFYEKVLGAKVEFLQRFGDMGGDPATADRIMHARLRIGPTAVLISDTHPSMGDPKRGDRIEVCLQLSDPAAGDALFAALAEGGTVKMPYQEMFWGAKYGQLTDAFGIDWMVNAELKK